LDGMTAMVDADDPEPGVGIIAEGCALPGGRSWYEPDATGRWTHRGDIPWWGPDPGPRWCSGHCEG
jgi:hypothetical protein